MANKVVIANFNKKPPSIIAPFNKMAKGKSSNPYANMPDISGVEPYKYYTSSQKVAIITENMRRNGNVIKSDKGGGVLIPSVKREAGQKVNPNAAEIDHDYPRSLGGWNTYANAMVLSNQVNIAKSNKLLPDT
jgi:5-methylcytosine-specific restriction endonuclease McrA